MKTLLASICSIAMLAAFAMPTFANPTYGTVTGVHRAPALGAGVHTITYNGGEQADFAVSGDHDTTLNILVKDALGNVVVRTSGPGDVAHVSWTPSRTQIYTIYVVNEGGVYNQYSYRGY
ncbi:MAG TPA: hypothetical protein VHR72_02945 [Gemmataceae bacterium]|jgi:hypothetical protein|nr:hypothetical protein [Gemmataceae bacterium]